MYVEVNISADAIEIGLGNKVKHFLYIYIFTFAISPFSPPLYVQVRQKGEGFAFPLW